MRAAFPPSPIDDQTKPARGNESDFAQVLNLSRAVSQGTPVLRDSGLS